MVELWNRFPFYQSWGLCDPRRPWKTTFFELYKDFVGMGLYLISLLYWLHLVVLFSIQSWYMSGMKHFFPYCSDKTCSAVRNSGSSILQSYCCDSHCVWRSILCSEQKQASVTLTICVCACTLFDVLSQFRFWWKYTSYEEGNTVCW
jgi:hypothetical protein